MIKSLDLKPGDKFTHYSEHQTNDTFIVVYLKSKYPFKLEVPYETKFCYDTAQVNNKIYFTGGGVPSSSEGPEEFYKTAVCITMEGLDDYNKEELPDMNHERADHTLTIIGESTLFVIGGRNSSKELDSCERLKIGSGKWEDCAKLNEKKLWASACTIQNRYIYIFGGSCNAKPNESNVIEYLDTNDTGAKMWTKIDLKGGADLWPHCVFVGTYELPGSKIMLFGGVTETGHQDETYIFDPETKTITKGGKLAGKDAFYRTKPGIFNNELMVVGTSEGDVHTYNFVDKKWTVIKKAVWNSDVLLNIKSDTY